MKRMLIVAALLIGAAAVAGVARPEGTHAAGSTEVTGINHIKVLSPNGPGNPTRIFESLLGELGIKLPGDNLFLIMGGLSMPDQVNFRGVIHQEVRGSSCCGDTTE